MTVTTGANVRAREMKRKAEILADFNLQRDDNDSAYSLNVTTRCRHPSFVRLLFFDERIIPGSRDRPGTHPERIMLGGQSGSRINAQLLAATRISMTVEIIASSKGKGAY